VPDVFTLQQNVPNPFNPNTTISFCLHRPGHVTVEVLNVNGQLVRTLVIGVQSAGSHNVTWDGRNSTGQQVASGEYLYRLSTEEFSQTRKMVLLR